MTKQEYEERKARIKREGGPDAEARVNRLTQFYETAERRGEDERRRTQAAEEARLKADLRLAYLKNPAATAEQFEADWPTLRAEYLRGAALKANDAGRRAQFEATRGVF